MAPTSIMLIRHAEKPIDGGPQGIDENGKESKHDLIVRGWERAGALGRFFLPFSPAPAPSLPVPTALFAPRPDEGDESVRAGHTLLPLAALAKLRVDQTYAVGDEKKLADVLLAQDGDLLVAWEHKHIKDIVKHVTNHKVKSPHWPGDRFDMVFLLSGAPDWTLRQVPEMVLDGDSGQPFPAETDETD